MDRAYGPVWHPRVISLHTGKSGEYNDDLMTSRLGSMLAAGWRRALSAPALGHGFIGRVPYAMMIRAAVIVSILARVALVSWKTGPVREYVPALALSAAGLGVALLDIRSEKFRQRTIGPVITVVLDIALIGSLYALSHDPRSDTFVLFALPLFIAADEFSRQLAISTLALTLGVFGCVVFYLAPGPNIVQQAVVVFLPRSVFLTLLMAAWASAVRSLKIKEWQLVQIVKINDELSQLESENEIVSAASLSASRLMGAEFSVMAVPHTEAGPGSADAALRSLLADNVVAFWKRVGDCKEPGVPLDITDLSGGGQGKVLAMPVSNQGRILAALILGSRSQRALHAQSIANLARVTTSHTAAALNRARILGYWRNLLEALTEVAQAMPAAQPKLNVELDRLLNEITDPLKFHYATVSIVDEYRDCVEMTRGVNVPPGWIRRSRYPLSSSDIIAFIARTQDTVVSEGWDDRFNREIYERFEHDRLARVFCPIVSRGRTIGILEAGVQREMRSKVLTADTVARVKGLCANSGANIEALLPQSLLRRIAELGAWIVGADAAGVDIHRGERGLLCAGAGKATAEFMRKNRETFERIRTEAISGAACQTIDNADELQQRFPDVYQLGIQSLAMLHVTLPAHEITGVLWIAFDKPHKFWETELEIESIFLRQIDVFMQGYFELTGSSETAERTWALSRLQTVIQSVPARFQLSDLLTKIARDLLYTLDADLVVIYQYFADQDQFDIVPVTKGRLNHPELIGKQISRSSVPWRFVHLKEPVYESNVLENSQFLHTEVSPQDFGFAVREGIRSAAVLVLRTEEPDEVVGLVFVNYRSERRFQSEDMQAMNALASSAAIAIRTARDRERAQRSVTKLERELAAVGAAPKAILEGRETMTPLATLDLLLKEAAKVTGAEAGVVLWGSGGRFWARSEFPAPRNGDATWIQGDDKLVQSLLQFRKTLLTYDVNAARAWPSRPILLPGARSQLVAPLFDRDALLGAIVLEHSIMAKFTEEDRRFVDALVLQGLIVLNTIDMYDQLRRQIMPQRALTTIATRIQRAQTLDFALRLLLTGVTAEQGLGFSRAMLLTFNEASTELSGRIAVGALTRGEAEAAWHRISSRLREVPADSAFSTLLDDVEESESKPTDRRPADPLTERIQQLSLPSDAVPGAVGRAIREVRPQAVPSERGDPWRALISVKDEPLNYSFVCCPLVWQNERIGVLVADDRYLPKERSPIEESRLVNLISFADMISLVILNAKLRDRSLVEAFRDLEHQLRSPLLNAGRIVHEILDHRPSKALADTAASTTVPTAPDIQSVLRTLHKVLGKARRVSRNTRLYAELSGYHPIRLRNLELLQPSMVNEMLAAAIREAELQRDDLLVEVDIPSLDVFETATVEFDTVLLEQVFGNVFDNVFKYAVKDSAVWVQAERKETHHQLLLRIENVARLTQEEAEKSTQRGFRGANAEEVAGEGSGLGLWIVDHIMRAHKGQVRLSVGADNRVVTEITFAEAKL